MNLQPIFVNFLVQDTLIIPNDKLKEFAYHLKDNSSTRELSNKGGFQSDFIEQALEVQELVGEINGRLEALRDVIRFKNNKSLVVESMWLNINSPYSYNSPHTHPGSYLSGSYYVDVPENSGKINFKNPSILQTISTPEDVIESYNEFNSSKWTNTPSAGTLLIFPSWIEHDVSQNLSDSDRISIAFNTEFVDNE